MGAFQRVKKKGLQTLLRKTTRACLRFAHSAAALVSVARVAARQGHTTYASNRPLQCDVIHGPGGSPAPFPCALLLVPPPLSCVPLSLSAHLYCCTCLALCLLCVAGRMLPPCGRHQRAADVPAERNGGREQREQEELDEKEQGETGRRPAQASRGWSSRGAVRTRQLQKPLSQNGWIRRPREPLTT